MVAESARQLLAAAWPRERMRRHAEAAPGGDDSDLWAEIVRSAFHALLVPGAPDDERITLMDVLPVIEQAGFGLAPSSFATSAVVARWILTQCDDTPLRASLAASSDRLCVIALDDARVARGEEVRVTGRARFVPDLEGASAAIVVMPEVVGSLSLTGATVDPAPTVDATRRFAHVELVAASVEELSAPARLDDRLRHLQLFVTACDCLGGSERALELAVGYAKERHQFGRAIGSFQSLQHLLADAYVAIENLRSACWYAAFCLEHERADREFAVLAASVLATKTYLQASDLNVQVHGGMGFTKEVDAYLYAARAKVNEVKDGTLVRRRGAMVRWLQTAELGPLVEYLGGQRGQIANSMSARSWYAGAEEESAGAAHR
jgi:hypothetical protein